MRRMVLQMSLAALISQSAVAMAAGADAASASDVVQKSDKAEVNFSKRTITVTGSGTFSNNASNAAQARLKATKAAKMDAQRNAIEALKGVAISSQATVGTEIKGNETKAKVEGVLRNFEVVDTKYFADGGVDVIIRVPLDGALAEALVGGGKGSTALADNGYTGVILDATGLKAEPALAPRVTDDAGTELYSASVIDKSKVGEHGAAAYVKSVDAAKAVKFLGDKPAIVKVSKLEGKTDFVVAAKDAKDVLGKFLSEGKVVVVTD